MVGTAVRRTGERYRRLDLTDQAATRDLVADLKPQVIVHSAAERRPDVSEKDTTATQKLNVEATKTIAESAKEVGAFVVYISTDYVFDGSSPPYSEGSQTNPLNNYGKSKLEGEKVMLATLGNKCVVLRIPVLYGQVEFIEESPVTILMKSVLDQKPAKVDHWGVRYPTNTTDVATVVRQIVDKHMQDGSVHGICHWSAPERLTKYEQCVIMAELFEKSHEHLTPDESAPPGAPRPRDTQLDTSFLRSRGIGKHTPFREGILVALKPFIQP